MLSRCFWVNRKKMRIGMSWNTHKRFLAEFPLLTTEFFYVESDDIAMA